jgi:hypothetical protein
MAYFPHKDDVSHEKENGVLCKSWRVSAAGNAYA